MRCRDCGEKIDRDSLYCRNCGTRVDNRQRQQAQRFSKYRVPGDEFSRDESFGDAASRDESFRRRSFEEEPYNNSFSGGTPVADSSSFGLAVLGFLFPILGIVLFFVFQSNKPKKAKSAIKGAITGIIIKVILAVVAFIFYYVFAASLISEIKDDFYSDAPYIDDYFYEATTEDLLENYVDVSIGELKISDNGYYSESSLDVTLKNKASEKYTYYVTIEAIDANGARLMTDMVYVDKLGAGQEIYLTAFEFLDQSEIEKLKAASFRVLEINKFDY